MQLDRRALAVAMALGLLAAACGSGGAATPTPTTAPQASQAAASEDTSQAASEAPASQEPASTDNVSLPPGTATELEAMLPSNVGGVAFAKTSFGGGLLPATLPGRLGRAWNVPQDQRQDPGRRLPGDGDADRPVQGGLVRHGLRGEGRRRDQARAGPGGLRRQRASARDRRRQAGPAGRRGGIRVHALRQG